MVLEAHDKKLEPISFTETLQTQAAHNPETSKAFAEVLVRKSEVTLNSRVTSFYGTIIKGGWSFCSVYPSFYEHILLI